MTKLINSKYESIGIVANDAGASNLILGWIRNNPLYNFHYCLSGPALKIFQQQNKSNINFEPSEIVQKCNFIITGTSYKSMIEHEARSEAKRCKIKSIAVIDHWVNYKMRFIRNNITVMPDIIWVFDKFAEEIAKNTFKNINIKVKKNYYLNDLVKKIKNINRLGDPNLCKILYVLEPIRKNLKIKSSYSFEFHVLDFFLEKLKKLNINQNIEIKLRLHPSESESKYKSWINSNNRIKLGLTINRSLEEDIAWSDIVVGYESFALVVASHSGKRCISSKLPNEENCRLMLENLEYLRDLY